MSKIKLTKGELKRQRDALAQFRHFLPTLQLKKQQLQMKILEARKLRDERLAELAEAAGRVELWAGLLADEDVDISAWVKPADVLVHGMNIAGTEIPIFDQVIFPEANYDFYTAPFWVDLGIDQIRVVIGLEIEVKIIETQINRLQRELRVTTQRVNLFEKIKIPELIENIRRIRIYLGDQMANAVGISKVAKKKIERREMAEVLT